jgi:hypothetical protein
MTHDCPPAAFLAAPRKARLLARRGLGRAVTEPAKDF